MKQHSPVNYHNVTFVGETRYLTGKNVGRDLILSIFHDWIMKSGCLLLNFAVTTANHYLLKVKWLWRHQRKRKAISEVEQVIRFE